MLVSLAGWPPGDRTGLAPRTRSSACRRVSRLRSSRLKKYSDASSTKASPFSHELLSYLPKATRLVAPVKDVFLDGLYWRSADAFTDDTDRLVSFFLTQVDDWTRDETFEVLVGLATRATHSYSATRLEGYIERQAMAARDQTWSEYLRRSDDQSNVQ